MVTTTNQTILNPAQRKTRINSLDVIRGIALLGILLMNINGMGLPYSYSDPSIAGGSEGLNLQVWIVNNMLFEGTMRGLFTLLFGAGVVLLTSRLEKNGAGITTADIYYRRILLLLLFGLINVWVLLWDGDILYPYALFALMLFPFRHTLARTLILTGCLLIAAGTLWDISEHQFNINSKQKATEVQTLKDQGVTLTAAQETILTDWEKFKTKKTAEEVQKNINDMQQGYTAVWLAKVKKNQFMQTWLPYRLWVWDILSYMLIGMAFFKLRIFHGERTRRFYWSMIIIGYAIGLTVNYFETALLLKSNFDAMTISSTKQTYQIGRLFTTIGHIGVFMLFIKSGILSFLQKALAAVGTLALTNYLMHSVITSMIFYGFGFSMFGKMQRFELYYIVGGIWIFQLIASSIWVRYFHFGPVEWLWRSLTYQKRQPFRISK